MKFFSSLFLCLFLTLVATVSAGKDLPKIAVWDLAAGNITTSYAQDLTAILVSEVSNLGKYEVYSQDNVRTLAGWTAERMTLGCTDTRCLTALGQMEITKLISGRVGKIGSNYSISLNLFDTRDVRAQNSVSELCQTDDELIAIIWIAVKKLFEVFEEEPNLLEQNRINKNLSLLEPIIVMQYRGFEKRDTEKLKRQMLYSLGPGLSIVRAVADGDCQSGIYFIEIWGRLHMYGCVAPAKNRAEE